MSPTVRLPSLLLPALLVACTPAKPPAFPTTPATVSAVQFQSLRWVVGRWHGVGPGMSFYESYVALDDSTIQAYGWADSTFTLANDSSQIRLRQGEVSRGRGDDASYVATVWDNTLLHFEPRVGPANAFTWRVESPDAWVATLTWTDNTGQPQGRVYHMTRIP